MPLAALPQHRASLTPFLPDRSMNIQPVLFAGDLSDRTPFVTQKPTKQGLWLLRQAVSLLGEVWSRQRPDIPSRGSLVFRNLAQAIHDAGESPASIARKTIRNAKKLGDGHFGTVYEIPFPALKNRFVLKVPKVFAKDATNALSDKMLDATAGRVPRSARLIQVPNPLMHVKNIGTAIATIGEASILRKVSGAPIETFYDSVFNSHNILLLSLISSNYLEGGLHRSELKAGLRDLRAQAPYNAMANDALGYYKYFQQEYADTMDLVAAMPQRAYTDLVHAMLELNRHKIGMELHSMNVMLDEDRERFGLVDLDIVGYQAHEPGTMPDLIRGVVGAIGEYWPGRIVFSTRIQTQLADSITHIIRKFETAAHQNGLPWQKSSLQSDPSPYWDDLLSTLPL